MIKHPHTRTYICTTADVRYIRTSGYLLGIVTPALWQLIFKRSPGFVLGVHVVLINHVLKEFTLKGQRMLVPAKTDSFSLLMGNGSVQYYLTGLLCSF